MSEQTIDLAGARAARREGKGQEIRVRLDADADPCVLPVEMPVDALAPIKDIQLERDLGLLFQARDQETGERVLRDLLTVRPALAGELLDAGRDCLERLFCTCDEKPWERAEERDDTGAVVAQEHDEACQWPRWLSWRPSPQDYVELIRGLWTAYGANLGEALAPSGSSGTGGATSKRTSSGTTRGSTRGASGKTPATTGS